MFLDLTPMLRPFLLLSFGLILLGVVAVVVASRRRDAVLDRTRRGWR